MRIYGFAGCTSPTKIAGGVAATSWLCLYIAAVVGSNRFEDENPDLLSRGWLFKSRRYYPGDPRWVELKRQAFGVGPDGSFSALPVLSLTAGSYLAGSRLLLLLRGWTSKWWLGRLSWSVSFGVLFVLVGHGGTGGLAVLAVMAAYFVLVRIASVLQHLQPPLGVAVLWAFNLFMLLFGWTAIFDPDTNSARYTLPFATWSGRVPYYVLRFMSLRMICYGVDYLDAVAAMRRTLSSNLNAEGTMTTTQSSPGSASDTTGSEGVSAADVCPVPTCNGRSPLIDTAVLSTRSPISSRYSNGSERRAAVTSRSPSCQVQQPQRTLRELTSTPLPIEWYGPLHYVSYMTYPLLYLTGPILGFNAYVWQCHEPHDKPPVRHLRSWIWWFTLAFLWEVALHFIYFTPWVFRDIPGFAASYGCPFWEAVVIANYIVTKEWMTLLLLWRFSRLTALLDSIDTVENMPQCVHFQCSFANLWRVWHASLNRFLIRYVYTRMTVHKAIAVWPTFFFVAVWHDNAGAATFLNFTVRGGAQKWYMWCFFNALGVMVEGLGQAPFMQRQIPCASDSKPRWAWQVLVGAVTSVAMLAGNLTVPLALPGVWDFLSYVWLSHPLGLLLTLVLTGLTSSAALAREEPETTRRMRARAAQT